MNTLTAETMLHSWEHAQLAHPLRRPLALLRAAWPEVDDGRWGALPIGERDACLLSLHEALFGSELDTIATCPSCSQTLELSFSSEQLRHPAPEHDAAAPPPLRFAGYELEYRLPGSDDLVDVLDAAAGNGRDAALARLLERCVLQARHHGEPAALDELPPSLVDHLQQEMARLDPAADSSVALECPACGHRFERRFDIGAYLWDELDDWAQRTLAEVHVLAGAYGWSEAQILALSASRRRHYISLVQG
jgi:hypothetical protein